MHAIDTDNARWCVTVARVGGVRRLYGVTPGNTIMTTLSNGRTLDPLSDLGKDYATLKAVRNLADNATKDLADARKRLSLIAIMAQTAMNRLDGNPGYLWPV